MSAWTPDELTRIGRADELEIGSRRPDGTLRPYVTVWTVRAGDDIYVRSAYGYDNPWCQQPQRQQPGWELELASRAAAVLRLPESRTP